MLQEKIEKALKESLKKKQEVVASTLRLLLSAIKNAQIEKRGELSDEEILKIIKREVKSRDEAVELYKKAGRDELVEKEEAEKKILQEYLPEELSNEEIEKVVDEVLKTAGDSPNFGQVMGQVMGRFKGRANGKKVAELVKEKIK